MLFGQTEIQNSSTRRKYCEAFTDLGAEEAAGKRKCAAEDLAAQSCSGELFKEL